MSRVKQGGTQKWCPICNSVQICAVINRSFDGERSSQRFHFKEHKDINWFRRVLYCLNCGEEWISAELPENFLDELIELRDALKKIKENAEEYAKESNKASISLKKLSESLSVLRALDSNKAQ